jgi:hypothetical protein
MAIENINVGISSNDGTGDPIRDAFIKCNDNFDELDFTKQDELVSGTNIKTIEGQSLIGPGNIDLTKSDVGLGNVDNTSDVNKPISSATQTALNAKQDTLVSGTNIKTIEGQSLIGPGNIDLTKSDVGLSNVDNTSDVNKPISSATQTALNAKQDTLVSGTNIKTINGNTILGSGDLTISGGITGTGTTNYIPKFNGPDAIQNSQIFDNGTNVGIGTNTPSSTLQVGNGIGLKNIFISGAGNNLALGGLSVSFLGFSSGTISTINTSGSVPLGVGTRSTQPLVLGTNNAEAMRITSGGNVGIGTQIPSYKFDVNGIINTNSVFRIGGSTTIGGIGSENSIFGIGGNDWVFYNPNATSNVFYTSGTERMRITSSGNVGIGTTIPNFETSGRVVVDVNGSSSSLLGLSIAGNPTSYIGTSTSGTEIASITNPLFFTVNGAVRMTAKSSGVINIANLGTGLVYSNAGDLTSTNPSDERLKNNITDLKYGLNEILQLRPVTYNWKNDTINQGKQFGFIAQEVQQIMPDLITNFTTIENNEEVIRLGLDKEAIFVAMVNAIKELKTEIEILKKK